MIAALTCSWSYGPKPFANASAVLREWEGWTSRWLRSVRGGMEGIAVSFLAVTFGDSSGDAAGHARSEAASVDRKPRGIRRTGTAGSRHCDRGRRRRDGRGDAPATRVRPAHGRAASKANRGWRGYLSSERGMRRRVAPTRDAPVVLVGADVVHDRRHRGLPCAARAGVALERPAVDAPAAPPPRRQLRNKQRLSQHVRLFEPLRVQQTRRVKTRRFSRVSTGVCESSQTHFHLFGIHLRKWHDCFL